MAAIRKFSEEFLLCFFSRANCFVLVREVSEVLLSSVDSYSCVPLSFLPSPANAADSAGAVRPRTLVPIVLYASTLAQILAAIIKRIVIAVVTFFSWLATENEAMHPNHRAWSFAARPRASSIKTARSPIPLRTPVPGVQPYKISGINNRVLALRKRDKSIRIVKWLRNHVSFYVARVNSRGHVRTSMRMCNAAILA